MTPATGALLGFGAGLGLLLILWGWRGYSLTWTPDASARTRTPSPLRLRGRREQIQALTGLALGVLVAAVSGWLAAVVLLPVLAVLLPRLLSAPATTSIDRLEALEEWSRALASLLGPSALITAIKATRTSTPAAIAQENERLIARLSATLPLEDSLRMWAEEIDDETGDYLATALIQASGAREAGLANTLQAIADDVAREVRARREILTEQRRSFTTARLIAIIAVVAMASLVLWSPLGAFYRTGAGQAVLLLLSTVFLAGLGWLHRLASPTPGVRILRPAAATDATDEVLPEESLA